jgi:hypothetical protein
MVSRGAKFLVIKDRERDVQVWKNVKVYFKWGWNKSPFDINSVVFHFDDSNYGRRSQPYCFCCGLILH